MFKNIFDFYRSKILYKLVFIFVVIVLITLQSVAFITLQISKNALAMTTLKSLSENSREILKEISFFIESRERILSSLSRVLEDKNKKEQRYFLALFQKNSPSLDYLAIYNLKGNPVAESFQNSKEKIDPQLAKEWILSNQTDARFIFEKEEPIILKKISFTSLEKENLFLIAKINLQRIKSITRNAARTSKTNFFIFSTDGKTLIHINSKEESFDPLKDKNLKDILRKESGTLRFNDSQGQRLLLAFVEEPRFKWKIIFFLN